MKNHLLKRQYAVAIAKKQKDKEFTELNYHVIKNGLNYWVADPFPIEIDGILYIFGEVFQYTKNKGSIGYTKLMGDKFTPWKIVIEEDYHLSFPNLFYKNKDLYMCPEANESNSIYLYKCKHFPDIWIKDKVIVQGGSYVDTVFYEKEGIEYGITYDIKPDNKKLRLFRNMDGVCEFGQEIENAECEYSRPAGSVISEIIKFKDVLPTQIGVPTYGAGLVLNTFDLEWPNMKLNPICKLYPRDFRLDVKREFSGIHTLNFTKHFVVIDVKWYGFNVINNAFKLVRRVVGLNKTSR